MAKQTFLNLKPGKKTAIKSAVYQLFTSRPYEEIGIRDITGAAGIALGAFYRYFEDKDQVYLDLFAEIESRLVEEDFLRLKDDFFIKYSQDIKDTEKLLTSEELAFCETFYLVPDTVLYKYYFQGYAETIYCGYHDLFVNLEKKGYLKEGMDAEFAYYIFITSFFNLIIFLRRQNMNTKEDVFRIKKRFYNETIMPSLIKPENLAGIYIN